MSILRRSALLYYFPNDQWTMSQNLVELRELSKVRKRPIDFNVTEYEKFLGFVSGPKLQL